MAEILGLSIRDVQEHARAGYLRPARGPGRRYRFSFQDLVLFRAAKALADAHVPQRRIRQSLRRLVRQLPRGRSLSAVRVQADGRSVVVRDGETAWNPESGQTVLDLSVARLAREAGPIARRNLEAARRSDRAATATDWYELGYELEATAPGEARDAYRRALELDPAHADAHVNLGRLLAEAGSRAAAVEHYRAALEADPRHATAAFNLGVALEALGRRQHAIAAYQQALVADEGLADAHFNLSRLYERAGRKQAALRHLARYRELSK